MKTFTIDDQNNITAFGSQEEAAATTATTFDSFSNEKELAELAGAWAPERLAAIWNGLPGVKPLKGFKSARAGAGRIWGNIQRLGEPETPRTERRAKGGAHAAKATSAKSKGAKKAKSPKHTSRAKKDPNAEQADGPREGTKTAQVVALLQRKNGATLEEIMQKMTWQKHTVRGFMAGAMKKAGYVVESLKSDRGERTYRIAQ